VRGILGVLGILAFPFAEDVPASEEETAEKNGGSFARGCVALYRGSFHDGGGGRGGSVQGDSICRRFVGGFRREMRAILSDLGEDVWNSVVGERGVLGREGSVRETIGAGLVK
jgi:hypothetical protein